jgi:hypothetical protein
MFRQAAPSLSRSVELPHARNGSKPARSNVIRNRNDGRAEFFARPCQASRFLNNQVAKVKVNTAIIAIGHVLFRISRGGMSFRKTPFITIMM